MKVKVITILLVAFSFILANICNAGIDDVYIEPTIPTFSNPITIITSGTEGFGGVSITDSDFRIDGVLLELDIFLNIGPMAVVTPWSHSEDIGTLSPGIYDLTVSTFEPDDPSFNDVYQTSFEVIPEPTTLVLLTVGLIGLRCRKQ